MQSPEQAPPKSIGWLNASIATVAIVAAAYQLLVAGNLEQTSALFIGLPTLLTLVVLRLPTNGRKSLSILRSTTLFCCVSFLVLGEGAICILMAAPLFVGVAVFICFINEAWTAYTDRTRGRTHDDDVNWVIILPFLFLSLEGVTDELSFERGECITVERIICATPAEVARQLAVRPAPPTSVPFYFQLGFPRPVAVGGGGTRPGDSLHVHFAGGEGDPGELHLVVAESSDHLVRWSVTSDTSHIAHWLDWKESRVEWESTGNGTTRVRWTLQYDRRLDPAWWFGPWERYAVGLAAGELIQHAATPAHLRD